MAETPQPWTRRSGIRFPIHAPIAIRATRTTPPSEGLTQNLSSHGVLYLSSSLPKIGARIFFSIHLWSNSRFEVWASGNGRVLRAGVAATSPDRHRWPFEVASTIKKYEIMRVVAPVPTGDETDDRPPLG